MPVTPATPTQNRFNAFNHQTKTIKPTTMNKKLKPPEDYGLLPCQSAFATNKSRFKSGLWARQTGKDHTCTFEAVADSIRNPGTLWVIIAAGERQARES